MKKTEDYSHMNSLANTADDREELLKIFPVDDDSRFRMNVRKVQSPREFFARTTNGDALLQTRSQILAAHPERHAALLPEGEEHFDTLAAYMAEHGAIDATTLAGIGAENDPQHRCIELARNVEPDFAIMRKGINHSLRLVGGAVCFPSSWAPETKMGMELTDIHAVVPGLNGRLGAQIHATLSNMRPGTVGMRADWSLKSETDLNHHPLQNMHLPDASVTLENSYIRVERQLMVGLPEASDGTEGIAFCIRIALYRILDFSNDPELRQGLLRTLRTMPHEVAEYKALTAARGPLIDQLA